ncbi:hypothetical protein Tdes44962_MAKER03643 [Teratosphaeria destructans]|uniref:Uncharacterized protein n=1 Tax=Teratosphaeria destructans TaxID=418781 RepID=A0A9W7SPM2_9PEZI|nr:hypothetical protein Tdes44962_MAKER03643 [Teratosphaeria destructans]
MATSARKRSVEEMSGNATEEPSNHCDGHALDAQPLDSQTDKQPITVSSTAAHTLASSSAMLPPPTPTQASSMGPPATKPPRSRQGHAQATVKPSATSPQAQQPTPSQTDPSARVPATPFDQDTDDQAHDETTSDASYTTSDPNERIEDFEWMSLQQRYHDRMREIGNQEQQISADFSSLCNYFGVWADASRTHEVGRSFKRLKTQIAYVNHEENQLEIKRQHYIKVVQAFQSALQLLNT